MVFLLFKYFYCLCLTASYTQIAAALLTFKESTKPNIGILINESEWSAQKSESPVASVPKIIADDLVKSVSYKLKQLEYFSTLRNPKQSLYSQTQFDL